MSVRQRDRERERTHAHTHTHTHAHAHTHRNTETQHTDVKKGGKLYCQGHWNEGVAMVIE